MNSPPPRPPPVLLRALKEHWPEYLMEAAELGLFMVSAALFGTLLEHPDSPVRQAITSPLARLALMGLAMGATAAAIVYSPIGKQSGAHFNPSVTLTFCRLGKVAPADAAFYVLAQFAGGIAGMLLAAAVLGEFLAARAVNYVATVPGPHGAGVAFATELGMTFILMSVVLEVSNRPRLARFTGCFAGALVATYIPLFAPLSGMSMNPARTAASAIPASAWDFAWIYFTAPLGGMLAAAQVNLWQKGARSIRCAKLHHQNAKRCIFCGLKSVGSPLRGRPVTAGTAAHPRE